MPQNGGTWSAQVESNLNSRLEQYHENHGVSKSETVRHLLREGLDKEKTDSKPTKSNSGLKESDLGIAAMLVAVALVVAGPLAGVFVAAAGVVGFAAEYYLKSQ